MPESRTGPRVSVVLSFADSAKHLGASIESILSQSYADFEFIMVVDGPEDGAEAIAASYSDPRIRLIHQARSGLTVALNRALDVARGEFVARQDADDIALPERFRLQVSYLEEHPDAGIVGGGVTLIDEDGRPMGSYTYGQSDRDLRGLLYRCVNPIPHTTMMFRRSVAAQLGNYNPSFIRAQDVDLIHRIAERHRLGAVPRPLCLLRVVEGGISMDDASGMEQRMYALAADAVAAHRRRTGVDVARGPAWPSVLARFRMEFERGGWPERHRAWVSLRRARNAFRRGSVGRGVLHVSRAIHQSPQGVFERLLNIQPGIRHHEWLERGLSAANADPRAPGPRGRQ